MKKYIIAALFISGAVSAEPYGPYNQQFTYNQQYGSTNWYSSPLGQGAAMAGVALVSGLVNAMSRPDPVVVVPAQTSYGQQAQYGQQTSYGQQAQQYNQNCRMQTVYDQTGNPRTVNICD